MVPAPEERAQVLNLANAITMLRVLLIPLQAWLIHGGRYGVALALFIVSALSDFADGLIARLLDTRTRFGAIADPLADKLTMLALVLMLAWRQALPWWFAGLVIGRDLVIVAGALCYHLFIGKVEMSPTLFSKLNTALQFALLAGVLAAAAGVLPGGDWLDALVYLTAATVVVSGVQYVVDWSLRAGRAQRPHRS